MSGDPRNPDLEAAIAKDPNDPEPYRVYADWLEGQGDIRAELIRIQLAAAPRAAPSKPVRKLFAEHRKYLLGPLSQFAKALTWRYGFVHAANLVDGGGRTKDHLETLLGHPSARFLVELHVSTHYLDAVIERLSGHVPASLRVLSLHHATERPLSIDALGAPTLHQLSLRGPFAVSPLTFAGQPRLQFLALRDLATRLPLHDLPSLVTLHVRGTGEIGEIDLPVLESAAIHLAEVSPESAAAIATARWPRIRRLEIDFPGRATIDGLAPLFQRSDLGALEELAIMGATFADEVCRLLVTAPFAGQLRVLDLSTSWLALAGAQALAASNAFTRLESIDVTGCDMLVLDDAEALEALGVEIVGDPRYDNAGE